MQDATKRWLTEDDKRTLYQLLDRGGTINDANAAIAIIDRLCAENASLKNQTDHDRIRLKLAEELRDEWMKKFNEAAASARTEAKP